MSESLKHCVFEACVIGALVASIIVMSGCITPNTGKNVSLNPTVTQENTSSHKENSTGLFVANLSMVKRLNEPIFIITNHSNPVIKISGNISTNPDKIEIFNNATVILHGNNTIEYR